MESQGNQHLDEVYSWEPSSPGSPCCRGAVTVGWGLRLSATGDNSPLEEGSMNWTSAVMGCDGRVNLCFQLTCFGCVEKLKIARRFFFFPPKKFILREISSARVLGLGGYAGGTRNQAFIACLPGDAHAGGLLSVYIWRDFHTESLE